MSIGLSRSKFVKNTHSSSLAELRSLRVRNRRIRKTLVSLVVLLATTVVGLAIGWNNIHSAVTVPWQFGFWLVASVALGFAFPRICWVCPAILAGTMYLMHLWAIRHGYHSPFVERSEIDAIEWLF